MNADYKEHGMKDSIATEITLAGPVITLEEAPFSTSDVSSCNAREFMAAQQEPPTRAPFSSGKFSREVLSEMVSHADSLSRLGCLLAWALVCTAEDLEARWSQAILEQLSTATEHLRHALPLRLGGLESHYSRLKSEDETSCSSDNFV